MSAPLGDFAPVLRRVILIRQPHFGAGLCELVGVGGSPHGGGALGLKNVSVVVYSVNDKVVVFDRVRENLTRVQTAGFPAIVDRSLNQVLARCLFTSGTTLAALVPMALWGGAPVAGFALPMIAGVIIATVSSLLVAGPLLAWMARGQPLVGQRASAPGGRSSLKSS